MTADLITDFYPGFPEISILLMACILLLLSVIRHDKTADFIYNMSIFVLCIAVFMVTLSDQSSATAFCDLYVTNPLTQLTKTIILLTSIFVMIIIPPALRRLQIYQAEIPILMLFANLGMLIMISASNFMMLYLGIELLSLTLYILVSIARHNTLSSEAGLKYFILGSLSSIFILYGISLIYGLTGSIFFHDIATQFASVKSPDTFMIIGFIMVIVGIAFKLSYAPFHMWTPDVYQGSPTPITTFLITVPKIALFFVLAQLFYGTFPTLVTFWQPLILILSILSIALGSIAALFQINIKRIMAYSTISQVGYMALAFSTHSDNALTTILPYIIIYNITVLGIFVLLMSLGRNGKSIEDLDGLRGLSCDAPELAFAFTVLLLSLAGIPPCAGFFVKLNVLQIALAANHASVVVIALLCSVISAAYYLKIIKYMYFEEPYGGTHALRIEQSMYWPATIILWASVAMTMLYSVLPFNRVAELIAHANALVTINNR